MYSGFHNNQPIPTGDGEEEWRWSQEMKIWVCAT